MALTPKFFQTRHSPRFLIIEDELQLVEWLDHKISEFGYVVSASAGTVWTARQELAKHNFDAVLLDAGLHQQHSTEIADLLLAKKIPFAFLAGHVEAFEPRHSKILLLRKPFTRAELGVLLEKLVGKTNRFAHIAKIA
jgi:DNA-binding response OmpR family regulator